jgi:hypothetical protein
MIERFKRGELDPRYYSTKNEEYNRELDRSLGESLVNVIRKQRTRYFEIYFYDDVVNDGSYSGKDITWLEMPGNYVDVPSFIGETLRGDDIPISIVDYARANDYLQLDVNDSDVIYVREMERDEYFNDGEDIEFNGKTLNEQLVNVVRKEKKLSTIPKSSNIDVINHFFDTGIHRKIENWGTNNLKIVAHNNGFGLTNYNTIIAWRTNSGEFYLNTNKYSSTTSKLQTYIRIAATKDENRIVHYVNEQELYDIAGVENRTGYYPRKMYESLVNVKKKNIKTYGDYPNGIWTKEQYDDAGNLIYFEDYLGYWSKREYDENNNRVYHETSSGKIIDKRNKIQE